MYSWNFIGLVIGLCVAQFLGYGIAANFQYNNEVPIYAHILRIGSAIAMLTLGIVNQIS